LKPAKTEGDWFSGDCLKRTRVEQRVQERMTNRIERKITTANAGRSQCVLDVVELVLKVWVIYDVFSLLVLFLAHLRGADRG
jgi:hypothetical protein